MAIPTEFQDAGGNEKRGILQHLNGLGFTYSWVDNILTAADVPALLLAADAYDPLDYVKSLKVEEIKQESRVRANAIYPFIDVEAGEAEAFYQFAEDIYLSIAPASRQPVSGNLLAFQNVKNARVSAIATVNGYTTEAEVDAYDAVNTPAWGG